MADFVKSRRSSRGHNWRSAKAHKIFPPQNLHHFLFLCHSHSRSHCNTVMHMTRSQRTCYPPQRKRATSATGTSRHHLSHPFFSSSRSQQVRVFPKPRQRRSLRPHQGPPSTRQISPPVEIVLANPPQRNSRSYEMLLHVEVHRWAPHLRRAVGPKANLAQPAPQLGCRFFGALHF